MTEIKTFVDLKGIRDLHIYATEKGLQMRSTGTGLLGGIEELSLLCTWEELSRAKVMMTELSAPEPTELEKAAKAYNDQYDWPDCIREPAFIAGAKWLAERWKKDIGIVWQRNEVGKPKTALSEAYDKLQDWQRHEIQRMTELTKTRE